MLSSAGKLATCVAERLPEIVALFAISGREGLAWGVMGFGAVAGLPKQWQAATSSVRKCVKMVTRIPQGATRPGHRTWRYRALAGLA